MDRFTETPTFQDAARHAAPCAHAVDSTHAPSGTIRPESSATSRKSAGGTAVPSRHHRTSASAPATRDVSRSTTGWYWTVSSWREIAPCRSLASSSRRTTSACMCAANTSTRPPPLSLALDIATSALRSTSPGGEPSASATPTLAVSATSRLATWNGAELMVPAIRSAMSAMSWTPGAPSIRTANSSPPQRATVSCDAATARSRRAAWASTRSPAPWPTESLTAVKPSRSRKMTPASVPSPRRRSASRARSSR